MSLLRAAVDEAAERIRPYVVTTPLEPSAALSQGGGEVLLKMENQQRTGSFKLRGAMNRLLLMTPAERERGVVAASSGNHGAAVSWGVRALGGRATVFVPANASPAKLRAIRDQGAEIVARGEDSGLSEIEARRFAGERGLVYLSPYNDLHVVAGQGTIGRELLEQTGPLDAVVVALGGGGLISGIGGYLKESGRDVEVVAASPMNSAVMHHSIEAGRVLDLPSRPTLSDGTAGAVEPGAVTLDLCRRIVDRRVLVSEREIRDAMRLVIERHHTLVEGAAGVAVAGYLKERDRWRGRRVAIVLCGANVSLEKLREVIA